MLTFEANTLTCDQFRNLEGGRTSLDHPMSSMGFVRRHKWQILGGTVAVGTGLALWRALRGIPLRQILAIASQNRDRSQGEVDVALKSGDGTRLFVVRGRPDPLTCGSEMAHGRRFCGDAMHLFRACADATQPGAKPCGPESSIDCWPLSPRAYLQACLRDLRNDLSALVDVQEKQAAVKAVDRSNTAERLQTFKELSTAALTRSVAAVYVVGAMQLLIQTQVFQLVRLQRQGRHLDEEAQRRFLTLVKALHAGEASILAQLVLRVELAVLAHLFLPADACLQGWLHAVSPAELFADANAEGMRLEVPD